ncbi:hypothetical protein PR202_gb07800 [Eleusine coracana subsp. coracana]|uniref:Cyclin N-terminal domain-containing protein n=1 Tax=Eleusine coracana subsp. coracana TaxID=191504 RepID=A0AAV5EBE1_ELECO|nr:hypothetical protein PR202_gb07800 [Eleusine coracana subsp. coracana]
MYLLMNAHVLFKNPITQGSSFLFKGMGSLGYHGDSRVRDAFVAHRWVIRQKELSIIAAGVDGYGGAAGREAAVRWVSCAAGLLAGLAAAYLDRCFLLRGGNGSSSSSSRLWLGGEPWMARLAAVACVALVAKVEETRVPLLVGLQLYTAAGAGEGEDEGVFDAGMVQRMELLVLSAMQWRMHPITPFSYLEPVLTCAIACTQQCKSVLLADMLDWRWPQHRPSSWTAAALLTTASSGDNESEHLALINAAEAQANSQYRSYIVQVVPRTYLVLPLG